MKTAPAMPSAVTSVRPGAARSPLSADERAAARMLGRMDALLPSLAGAVSVKDFLKFGPDPPAAAVAPSLRSLSLPPGEHARTAADDDG